MKNSDIFKMCRDNLFRRKARTFLSVLGVIVGSCSIMIMISIGVGMTNSETQYIEEMGDLTTVSVYPRYDSSDIKLDDDAVRSFKALPNVALVAPKMTMNELSFTIYAGKNNRYRVLYPSVCGYDAESLGSLGFELIDGEYPKGEFTALMGEHFEYAFSDTKRPEGHNMIEYYMYDEADLPDPYMKLDGEKVKFAVTDNDGKEVYSQEIKITGKLKENYAKTYETTDGLILQTSDIKKIMKEAARNLNQKQKTPTYDVVTVKATDINTVEDIQKQIDDMGFQTESMESMRKSTQKEMAKIQLVLGGIGAVSLFVAAIGITNTMIMSVSERTKEIGIMKALGCYVFDIKKLFLMEAGSIGLLGGVFGTVISFLISCIVDLIYGISVSPTNNEGEAYSYFQMIFTSPSRISVIPFWLVLFGIGFSVLIGLISGMYPANKAVKISALEAMKNE
ncbi:MAG: ABC transporter permease [Clostridiales bacterium]|nr:ABC transporter permease [Clostridiales bacterium]